MYYHKKKSGTLMLIRICTLGQTKMGKDNKSIAKYGLNGFKYLTFTL